VLSNPRKPPIRPTLPVRREKNTAWWGSMRTTSVSLEHEKTMNRGPGTSALKNPLPLKTQCPNANRVQTQPPDVKTRTTNFQDA